MNRGQRSYFAREVKRYRDELLNVADTVAICYEYGNGPSDDQKRKLIAASHRHGVAAHLEGIIKGKNNADT